MKGDLGQWNGDRIKILFKNFKDYVIILEIPLYPKGKVCYNAEGC